MRGDLTELLTRDKVYQKQVKEVCVSWLIRGEIPFKVAFEDHLNQPFEEGRHLLIGVGLATILLYL